MTPENMKKVVDLCNQLSNITYENLTKIIRLEQTGSATGARKLDDSDQNDIDSWMGGGTCFSMTWHLYQTLTDMGFKPRLVMGHKRKERNIHCALILPDPDSSLTTNHQPLTTPLSSEIPLSATVGSDLIAQSSYLLDPGYLIFDPLPMPLPQPFGTGEAFFPLAPNCVRLVRPTLESMELWTGGAGAPMKLRFEYPIEGVSVEEFKHHWNESFYREMMTYPVLNRLDREKGVQYYYQKGNLVVRNATGSQMTKIAPADRVQTLSDIFKLSPDIIEKALNILEKR
jgi:hypothetical protein